GRAVEGGKESVAGGVDLPAPVRVQAPPDPLMMRPLQVAPAGITELARPLGRPDDVGEHHRCQHPVCDRGRSGAGQELLHLIQQGILVAGEGLKVRARQVHKPGVRDAVGEVAAVSGSSTSVSARYRTSVGAWIEGSTARMSMSRWISNTSRMFSKPIPRR